MKVGDEMDTGIIIFIAVCVIVVLVFIALASKHSKQETRYPQLDIHDKWKISQGVHYSYELDKRTGRIRDRWDKKKYLLPNGGTATDHYPLTDAEYEKQERDKAERARQEEAIRVQQAKEAKYPLLVKARAEGHDVCFDCGNINPPRCCYCDMCLQCNTSYGDSCIYCDSSDD